METLGPGRVRGRETRAQRGGSLERVQNNALVHTRRLLKETGPIWLRPMGCFRFQILERGISKTGSVESSPA